MTANWFEAKVKYVKVGEDGKEKKMSELYLLDAMSYTEAESRITENLREMIQGDFYIVGLKKSNITELVESTGMTISGSRRKWRLLMRTRSVVKRKNLTSIIWWRQRILRRRWLICRRACQLTWCLSRLVL